MQPAAVREEQRDLFDVRSRVTARLDCGAADGVAQRTLSSPSKLASTTSPTESTRGLRPSRAGVSNARCDSAGTETPTSLRAERPKEPARSLMLTQTTSTMEPTITMQSNLLKAEEK